ncbi:unnamed protein product [Sphagnum tenellum]
MTTWHTVSQLILPVTINQTQAYGHVPPLISWPSPPNGHWSALAYSHSVKSQQEICRDVGVVAAADACSAAGGSHKRNDSCQRAVLKLRESLRREDQELWFKKNRKLLL